MAYPVQSVPPEIALVPLTLVQKTMRCLPALQRLFWVPAGCLTDEASFDAFANTRSETGENDLQHVQIPDPTPAISSAQTQHRLSVSRMTPGKVIGDALLAATRDDVVAGNLQALHGVSDPARHWLLRRCRYRRQTRLAGNTLLLAAGGGDNYYHWLFDSLPRLRLLELAGYKLDQFDHVLLNQRQSPFHHQTLDRYGIPFRKRRACSKAQVLLCESLVIPSIPAPPMVFPMWVRSFLRATFLLAAETVPEARRLFISRRGAARRKLVNEPELELFLHDAGFKTICLEECSFARQVGLFASADVIVATHGAGLSNLVFAGPGARVIELVAPTFINHCYQKLAAACQLHYEEIIGAEPPHPRKRPQEDDVWVPLEALRKALSECAL